MRGAAIILSPWFKKAYERAGRQPPVCLNKGNLEFVGRFLGIMMSYPNHDSYGKRTKGETRLFIASVYHPHDEKLYDEFNKEVMSILSDKAIFKKKTTVIIGHDINAGIGTRKTGDDDYYNKVLGPYGIDRRNQKGKQLLNFLAVNKLRLMNSFYKNASYSTWFDIKTGDSHMLDAWSTNTQKIFQNCAVCHDFGLTNSDHIHVLAEIELVSI